MLRIDFVEKKKFPNFLAPFGVIIKTVIVQNYVAIGKK